MDADNTRRLIPTDLNYIDQIQANEVRDRRRFGFAAILLRKESIGTTGLIDMIDGASPKERVAKVTETSKTGKGGSN